MRMGFVFPVCVLDLIDAVCYVHSLRDLNLIYFNIYWGVVFNVWNIPRECVLIMDCIHYCANQQPLIIFIDGIF